MLRRHQLGADRERCRDGKAAGEPGQEPDGNQLLGVLHKRDHQGEERRPHHANLHDPLAAPMVGYRRGGEASDAEHQGRRNGKKADVARCQMQRLFRQNQQ